MFTLSPKEVNLLEKEESKWYWYTSLPEEFFIKSFIPGKSNVSVNEMELIAVANHISNGLTATATPISTTAVMELFNRGYVTLEFCNVIKDFNSPILIVGKEFDKEHCNNTDNFLLMEYEGEHYTVSVVLTEDGNFWLNSCKEKYPELFQNAFSVEKASNIKPADSIPYGYAKHGILHLVPNDKLTCFSFVMTEQDN